MRFRSFFFLSVLIFIFSCQKKSKFEGKLIGHGISGFGTFNQMFPSNSLGGLDFSTSIDGVNGLEIDIQCTKDFKFVCYHDEFLENSTQGFGRVSDYSLDELIDINYLMDEKEKLLSWDELSQRDLSDYEVFLDVKFDADNRNTNEAMYKQKLEELISNLNSVQVHVLHEDISFLRSLNVASAQKHIHIVDKNNAAILDTLTEIDGVIARNSVFDASDWANIRSKGYKTIIFDAKANSALDEMIKKSPDYFFADDLLKILQYK